MLVQFRIVAAAKCPKKDVISALAIYCHAVDSSSFTDTNQIKDYIWNYRRHLNENRRMFFYLLYDQNEHVIGYSEFAYLPQNQALVLDYLCTHQRNHMLFYNFYHMVVQEISGILKDEGYFVRFIVTELSLNQIDGKLVDSDSNYFRHMLSNEGFRLLKYPYYQPSLSVGSVPSEFNIAIKPLSMENGTFLIAAAHYLSIIRELYFSHYYEWYSYFGYKESYKKLLNELFQRIQQEIPNDSESKLIDFVQCHLFEEGQCPKFTAENITISRERKKRWRVRIYVLLWIFFSIGTIIFCMLPSFSNITTIVCSFFTIISGVMAMISFKKTP